MIYLFCFFVFALGSVSDFSEPGGPSPIYNGTSIEKLRPKTQESGESCRAKATDRNFW